MSTGCRRRPGIPEPDRQLCLATGPPARRHVIPPLRSACPGRRAARRPPGPPGDRTPLPAASSSPRVPAERCVLATLRPPPRPCQPRGPVSPAGRGPRRGENRHPAPPALPASSSAAPQPISCRLSSPAAALRLVRRGAIRRAGPRYVPSDNPPGPTIARPRQSAPSSPRRRPGVCVPPPARPRLPPARPAARRQPRPQRGAARSPGRERGRTGGG